MGNAHAAANPGLAFALRQTAPASRSDPVASAVAWSSTNSGSSGLATPVGSTGYPGCELRIAQPASAIVTRVRRHRPPPVRALRFQLCYQGGNVAARPFTLFVLCHCQSTYGTKRRNSKQYPDHMLPP